MTILKAMLVWSDFGDSMSFILFSQSYFKTFNIVFKMKKRPLFVGYSSSFSGFDSVFTIIRVHDFGKYSRNKHQLKIQQIWAIVLRP